MNRGPPILEKWNLIPADTDILLTHGPPYKILDTCSDGFDAGCKDLLDKVLEIKPIVHLFGHIHEAYGETQINKTHYINASVLNVNYELVNEPVMFEL